MDPQQTTGGQKIKKCPACNGEFPADLVVCPNDRTMLLTPKKDELIGQILNDRYKVVEEVGRGGMSAVYRGVHELMDRTVAIKVLLPQLVSDQISIKRFQQEAQAASHLQHPNVITVYDYGFVASGQPYLVMDFLEGESLSEIIKADKHVPVKRVIPIFMQACEALEHAHQKGVIHRDLKSSNIMLIDFEGKKDFVKVVDFGIAKLMPSSGKQSQNLTQTGEVFGSPIYMSPEQCMAQSLDARSDIYSMGAMIYEALTGQPPLMGQSIIDTMQMHMSTPPKPFKEIRPDLSIPDALERVVLKALAKKPEQRYQSMQELRDAMEGVSKLMDQEKLFGASPQRKGGVKSTRASKVAAPDNKPGPGAGGAPGSTTNASRSQPVDRTEAPVQARETAGAKRTTEVRQKEAAKKVTVPAKGKAPGKKESEEAREGTRFNPLEKLKEIEWLKPTSPIFIGISLLILAGFGALSVFLFNSMNLAKLFSMQTEGEGLTYYYKPSTTKKGGMLYLWTVDPEDEEGLGQLLKISTEGYNLEDRAAYAQGAGIGDYWKVKYHRAGSKLVIDEAVIEESSSSEDLRQITSLIKRMFAEISKPEVDPNAMMNFYTEDWQINDFAKMREFWGKESLKFNLIANPNDAPKNAIKIEQFDKDQGKASVLVKTDFWVKQGPRYMRMDLIKKDGKKWLIAVVEEIAPQIWQNDGVTEAKESDDDE